MEISTGINITLVKNSSLFIETKKKSDVFCGLIERIKLLNCTNKLNAYNYRPQPNYIPPVNHRYVPPQHTNQNYNQNYPYQATSLLTEREYGFFRVLKVIANRNNMDVLIKVRLADLVKVSESVPTNEFYKYFNKISSKHIDFLLIDGIKVVTLIELDDNTHNRKDRIERDNFVNETVTKCGYRIIHTYGDTKQIEDAIIQYRNPTRNTIG